LLGHPLIQVQLHQLLHSLNVLGFLLVVLKYNSPRVVTITEVLSPCLLLLLVNNVFIATDLPNGLEKGDVIAGKVSLLSEPSGHVL